jgi:hypothetical protein
MDSCWPAIRNDGKINAEAVLDLQEWYIGRGFSVERVSPEQFLDSRFVDFANRVLDAKVAE